MHITSDTASAFLIGVVCSFTPGVLFMVAWLGGHVRVQERYIERETRARRVR